MLLCFISLTSYLFLSALHSSLLKDIERESKQILEPDHHKLYYVVGWLLQFRAYLHSKWKADVQKQRAKNAEKLQIPQAAGSESVNEGLNADIAENPANFDLVASAIDIRFFLLCIRRMRQTLDEKRWLDVQACAECFKQMVNRAFHPECFVTNLTIQTIVAAHARCYGRL
jgi:hypothetical protein